MTDQSGGRPGPDTAKLIYSARMLYVSAGLFASAGLIWLVSGNGMGIGVVFVGIGLVLAASGRAVSKRA